MKLLLLVVLGLLMQAAGEFAPPDVIGSGPAATTLAFGFLLLSAVLAGSLCARVGLPRLTGYLAAGVLSGPSLLGLVSSPMLGGLDIFRGMAAAFAAILAGSELSFAALRPGVRGVLARTITAILLGAGALFVTVYLGRPLVPGLPVLDGHTALALALMMAVALTASSPLTAVAMQDETAADGPLVRTTVAAASLGSVVVVALFAVAAAVADGLIAGTGDALKTGGLLGWTLIGSLVCGAGLGVAYAAYLRRLRTSAALFAAAAALVASEIGPRVHLDPLLLGLSAGVYVRNATTFGARLEAELRAAAQPVYITFFAVAGATLYLPAHWTLGVAALALVVARGAGVAIGWRLGGAFGGGGDVPAAVPARGAAGLLPQADFALTLGAMAISLVPAGGALEIVLSTVAINALVAPILLRACLAWSGEIGVATRAATARLEDEDDDVEPDDLVEQP
ncbi:MAG TPA: cation:proton antiporter [Kofleriaceae bacterium]|nr:cation:proton antiporter [Kofleriaceae bacterium]